MDILGLKTSEECQETWWSASLSDLVSRLFKVSKLVGKSTTTDRHARAEATRAVPFASIYDVAHVQHKFEKLSATPWLAQRLGESNAKRRNYFRWCRTHREKLAGPLVSHSDEAKPNLRDRCVAKSTLLSIPMTSAQTADSRPSNVHTVASTLGFVDMQAVDDGFDDTCSISTMATSVFEDQGSHALSVPKLTDIAEPGVDFECPYCLTIQKLNGDRGWR